MLLDILDGALSKTPNTRREMSVTRISRDRMVVKPRPEGAVFLAKGAVFLAKGAVFLAKGAVFLAVLLIM
jgi:hypothetical protein